MTETSRSYFPLPVKLILVVPFVVQIFAAVGLVGYLSFRNGQKAVDTLAADLIDKTNDSVTNHLDSYLAVPQTINHINADAVKLGLLDVNDPEKAARYFWGQMQVYDLTYVGYGLTTGAGAGVAKYDGNTLTLEEWTGQLPNNVSNYAVDDEGNRAGLNEKWDFDNFNEAWYNEPIDANRPIWAPIYVWSFPGGYPYITASASRPIFDGNDRLLGMIAADIHLLKLSDFLKELEISPSGQIFIIERDGMLIANSGITKPFKLNGDDIQRTAVKDSTDPLTQQITQQLQEKLGGWNVDVEQQLELRVNGNRYYVRVKPWHDEYGLDWVVVTIVPELDFTAELNANNRITFFLCLAALVAATILGIFTSQRITQPVFKLNQASQKLAAAARDRFATDKANPHEMELLDIRLDRAGIQELDGLADSFSLMAQQLQQTFSELEALNEDLEERVDVRTQELQNTLRELHYAQAHMLQNEKMSALGQMVAGVAHEVNNPINFIYGNLQHANDYVQNLLGLVDLYQQKQTLPDDDINVLVESIDLDFVMEDLPKVMASMQVGAERIREIVKSLRIFSRLDESEFKTADIHEGIDSTLMILKHRTKGYSNHSDIQITKDYDGLLLIECYPGQLNQVFMNILSNAIDALEMATTDSALQGDSHGECASPELSTAPPIIHIQTRQLDNGWVTISISDNGPGIPKDVQTRLFDPFFTTKPVGQGTGMGLAISHEIIAQKHGGTLTCTSSLGEGTQFLIKIPSRQSIRAMQADVILMKSIAS